MTKKLEFFEFPNVSGAKPKNLVIFLHGYGSSGKDLLSLSHEFCKILPDAHFLSPNAPYSLEGAFFEGYQWFSLSDYRPEIINPQIIEANDILDNFITIQTKRFNLTRDDLIFAGFSQGSMMSIYNSLRNEIAVKGVLAFSGKLILPTYLGEEIKSKPPICLIHGTDDQVLTIENFFEAKEALTKLNIPLETHELPHLGHSVDSRAVKIGKNFLSKITKDNIIYLS